MAQDDPVTKVSDVNEASEAVRGCELCERAGGDILWRDDVLRVIWVPQAEHPGFCRVISNAHVKEMTHLDTAQRARIMDAVFATEAALIDILRPDKINLASFGNVVPHLHWHAIPRFSDDPHFPNPVWGAKLRETPRALPADFAARMRAGLRARLG